MPLYFHIMALYESSDLLI